jgi:hypothetical protein
MSGMLYARDRNRPFQVILPTTQRYYYCELGPFFVLWERYWPNQPVTVMADGDPKLKFEMLQYFDMPGRFRTNNMWIMHQFSSGIRWYVQEQMDDDIFFMIQTDHWLTGPVNIEAMRTARAFMEANPEVVRVSLCGWPETSNIEPKEEWGGLEFWGCKDDVQKACFALLSNQPALWNRNRLLEVWQDGWDGWACEIRGVDKMLAQYPNYRSLVARPVAMRWMHICYTRGDKYWRIGQLPEEARKLIWYWVPKDFRTDLQ